MSQGKVPAADAASPCIGVCRLNDDGFCEGCLRSIEEIGAWAGLDDVARRAIMDDLEHRRG